MYKDALFQKYGIRNCFVRITRLNEDEIPKSAPKRLLKTNGTVRSNSNISWLPNASSIHQNSTDALNYLANYQNQNNITPRVAKKSVYIYFSLFIFNVQLISI